MIKDIVLSLPSLTDNLRVEKSPIFLYGMGNGAEKINEYLVRNRINIAGVVASEGFVRGHEFLGHKVISVSQAAEAYGDICLVLCFGLEGEKSRFIKELAKKHRILSPNLPVFGNVVCDKEFILENIEKFQRVFDNLADDLSKEIFLNLIKYNVTGEMSYLEPGNDTAPDEFYRHEKRHIDIGAYNGDTVLEFIEKNDSYKDIIAFEPDENTYRHLLKNTANVRGLTAVNAAAGRKNGKIGFVSGGGRASHCIEGSGETECCSVDEYCGFTHIRAEGVPVGSIKIDAEGMDEEVIYGAVNTIYCCKPNISVALYHRGNDIIDLPLLLKKHNHKYDLYLRKKEYVPAWDVFLYAISR